MQKTLPKIKFGKKELTPILTDNGQTVTISWPKGTETTEEQRKIIYEAGFRYGGEAAKAIKAPYNAEVKAALEKLSGAKIDEEPKTESQTLHELFASNGIDTSKPVELPTVPKVTLADVLDKVKNANADNTEGEADTSTTDVGKPLCTIRLNGVKGEARTLPDGRVSLKMEKRVKFTKEEKRAYRKAGFSWKSKEEGSIAENTPALNEFLKKYLVQDASDNNANGNTVTPTKGEKPKQADNTGKNEVDKADKLPTIQVGGKELNPILRQKDNMVWIAPTEKLPLDVRKSLGQAGFHWDSGGFYYAPYGQPKVKDFLEKHQKDNLNGNKGTPGLDAASASVKNFFASNGIDTSKHVELPTVPKVTLTDVLDKLKNANTDNTEGTTDAPTTDVGSGSDEGNPPVQQQADIETKPDVSAIVKGLNTDDNGLYLMNKKTPVDNIELIQKYNEVTLLEQVKGICDKWRNGEISIDEASKAVNALKRVYMRSARQVPTVSKDCIEKIEETRKQMFIDREADAREQHRKQLEADKRAREEAEAPRKEFYQKALKDAKDAAENVVKQHKEGKIFLEDALDSLEKIKSELEKKLEASKDGSGKGDFLRVDDRKAVYDKQVAAVKKEQEQIDKKILESATTDAMANGETLSKEGQAVYDWVKSSLSNDSKKRFSANAIEAAAQLLAFRAQTWSKLFNKYLGANCTPLQFAQRYKFVFFDDKIDNRFSSSTAGLTTQIFTADKTAKGRLAFSGKASTATLFHEMAHMFFADFALVAESPLAPQKLKDDFKRLREWIGNGADKTSKEYTQAPYFNSEQRSKSDGGPVDEERFAQAVIKHIADADTPIPWLNKLFADLKAEIQSYIEKFMLKIQKALGKESEKSKKWANAYTFDFEIPADVKRIINEVVFSGKDEVSKPFAERTKELDDLRNQIDTMLGGDNHVGAAEARDFQMKLANASKSDDEYTSEQNTSLAAARNSIWLEFDEKRAKHDARVALAEVKNGNTDTNIIAKAASGLLDGKPDELETLPKEALDILDSVLNEQEKEDVADIGKDSIAAAVTADYATDGKLDEDFNALIKGLKDDELSDETIDAVKKYADAMLRALQKYQDLYDKHEAVKEAEKAAKEASDALTVKNKASHVADAPMMEDADDSNKRYVNKTRDSSKLIALHNLSMESLSDVIFGETNGAFVSPSLAIIRDGEPYNNYGEITLIGDKELIDPSTGAAKVYERDAWTPTIPKEKFIDGESYFFNPVEKKDVPFTRENLERYMLKQAAPKVRLLKGRRITYEQFLAFIAREFKSVDDMHKISYKLSRDFDNPTIKANYNKVGNDALMAIAKVMKSDDLSEKHLMEELVGKEAFKENPNLVYALPNERALNLFHSVKNLVKTEYFEAKSQKTVELGDFKAAVVPQKYAKSQEVRAMLDAGVHVEFYDSDSKIGTVRQKALNAALHKANQKAEVKFSVRESKLGKALYQAAWHGTPHIIEGNLTTERIGTGEGAAVHGWGLYFAKDRDVAQTNYRERLRERDFTGEVTIKDTETGKTFTWNIENSGALFSKDNAPENNLPPAMLDALEAFQEKDGHIRAALKFLAGRRKSCLNEVERWKNEAPASKEDVIAYEKAESKLDLDDLLTPDWMPEKENKSTKPVYSAETIKRNLLMAEQNLQTIEDAIHIVENIDTSKAKEVGELLKVELPENDTLLIENETFENQPPKVQEALKKCFANREHQYPIPRGLLTIQSTIEMDSDTAKDAKLTLRKLSNAVRSYNANRTNNFKKDAKRLLENIQTILMDFYDGNSSAVESLLPEIFDETNFLEGGYIFNSFNEGYFSTSILDKIKGFKGKLIYQTLGRILGDEQGLQKTKTLYDEEAKLTSKELNKYGINGIHYWGEIDGECFVIFDDDAIAIQERYDAAIRKHQNELLRSRDEILEKCKKLFGTDDVRANDNGTFTITTKGGNKFTLDIQNKILINDAEAKRARKEHGIADGTDMTIEGYYRPMYSSDVEGIVSVSLDSRENTEVHEATHAAIDLALNEQEKKILFDRAEKIAEEYGIEKDAEEIAADAVRNFVSAREHGYITDFAKSEIEKLQKTPWGRMILRANRVGRKAALFTKLHETELQKTAWGRMILAKNKLQRLVAKLMRKVYDFVKKAQAMFEKVDNFHDLARRIELGEVWEEKNLDKNADSGEAKYSARSKPRSQDPGITGINEAYKRKLEEAYAAGAGDNRITAIMNEHQKELAEYLKDKGEKQKERTKLRAAEIRSLRKKLHAKEIESFSLAGAVVRLGKDGKEVVEKIDDGLPNRTYVNKRHEGEKPANVAQKLGSRIAREEPKTRTQKVKEWIVNAKSQFYKHFVDKYDALHLLDDAIAKASGKKIDGANTILGRMNMAANSASGMAMALLEGNADELKQAANKYGIKNMVSLQMLMEKIGTDMKAGRFTNYVKSTNPQGKAELEEHISAIENYLVARSLLESAQNHRLDYDHSVAEWEKKGSHGDKPIFEPYKFPGGMTEQEIRQVIKEAPDGFKEYAKMFKGITDNMLDILYNTGLITGDRYLATKSRYKAYCPLMRDFSDTAAVDSFIDQINSGKGLANVSDPLKNRSSEGSERDIVPPLRTIVTSINALTQKAERNRVGQYAVKQANKYKLDDYIKEVKGNSGDAKNCIFTVMFNGEKHSYQTIPEMYPAITAAVEPLVKIEMALLTKPAQWLRTGSTMSPSFILRNLIRDTLFAGIASKNGFIPIYDSIRGMNALLNNQQLRSEFNASGVISSNFYGDGESVMRSLESMAGGKKWQELGLLDIIKGIFHKPIEGLEWISNLAEAGTRMGEFMRAREKGKSVDQAAYDAVEITLNFGRSGATGQQINRMVPFFNACIQGGDKLYRLYKADPRRTLLRIGTYIVLPSIVLWLWNHDEDWYKELDPNIKMTNWILPNGIRIPKPQEAGILFGSGAEAMLDTANGQDPKAMANWRTQARDALMPGVIPTLFLPLAEWITNYSFFRGKPIVSKSQERLPDELQYGPYTSEMSKALGDNPVMKLSPVKIDNLWRGYTGTMGMFLWQAPDLLIAEKRNLPEKKLSEMAFVRDFVVNDMNLTRTMNDFYQLKEASAKWQAGYGKKGKPTVAVSGVNTAANTISKLQKEIRDITTNPKYTPAQKRMLVDKNRAKQQKVAQLCLKKYGDKFDI